MKHIKLILSIVFLLCVNNLSAQTNFGQISDFKIAAANLENSNVVIDVSKTTTTINYEVTYARQAGKNTDFKFCIGTITDNNSPVFFDTFKEIKNSSFETNVFIKNSKYSVNVNTANLTPGKRVYLFYQTADQSNVVAYSFSSYGIQIGRTAPVTPPPSGNYVVEGQHIGQTGRDPIYIVMDGKLRQILSMDTYLGIFKRNTSLKLYQYNTILESIYTIGAPIQPGARIVFDLSDGKTYFQEGNIIRWISGPAVADRYNFQLNGIQTITATDGYVIGPNMY